MVSNNKMNAEDAHRKTEVSICESVDYDSWGSKKMDTTMPTNRTKDNITLDSSRILNEI